MKIYAIAMMRDEEDVAEHVVRHLLSSDIDGVIIAENLSADLTLNKQESVHAWAAKNYPAVDFQIIHDAQPAYYQWSKMTALAHLAGRRGATIILPFDADEVWYAPEFPSLRAYFSAQGSDTWVFEAEMFNHIASGSDLKTGNPFVDIQYRRSDLSTTKKIAFRYQDDVVLDQGNHVVAYQSRSDQILPSVGGLCIRHFQWRGEKHFLQKIKNGAAAYKLTDLPETIGSHWRSYGEVLANEGETAALKIYHTYFYVPSPETESGLILDPAPVRS
jgi:hypothetical protein